MENNGKNLSESLRRLSALVNHLNSLESGVSAIERDLLLQELREVYALVLALPLAEMPLAVEAEPEMAAETDMVEEAPVHDEEVLEPELEEEPEVVNTAVAEEPVEVEVSAEPESVKEEIGLEEVEVAESPFAEPEPEPEPEPAPAPVMEEIEGNPFEDVFEEPAVEEPIVEDPVVEQPIVEEPKVAEPVVEQPKEISEEAKVGKAKKNKSAEQPSLFDYLNTTATSQYEQPKAPTLADKIATPHVILEQELEHKVTKNKVSDLRTVININDKFSFMNELFRNNMKAYNDFILKLNAIESREEALAATAEVAEQYKWSDDSLAVRTFYKILDRKF